MADSNGIVYSSITGHLRPRTDTRRKIRAERFSALNPQNRLLQFLKTESFTALAKIEKEL